MKTSSRMLLAVAIVVAVIVAVAVGFRWYITHQGPERLVLTGGSKAAGVVIAASGEPALHAELASTGLTGFQVTGGAGEMLIGASSDGKIHVDLELRQQQKSLLWLFHWMSDDTTRDIMSASLQQVKQRDVLKLGLVYPSGDDRSDIQEHWVISLPAELLLAARMEAGRLVIEGMEGGIGAHLSAGDLTIRSPRGVVRASVGAGRLHVGSDTTTPGNITLDSIFGLAILSLDGQYYGPPEKHGGLNFFGNSVVHSSGGKDDIELKVTAGLVDLRVGPLSDERIYRDAFSSK